jgi:hypothetical protein
LKGLRPSDVEDVLFAHANAFLFQHVERVVDLLGAAVAQPLLVDDARVDVDVAISAG